MKILCFNESHNIAGAKIRDFRTQRGLTQEQMVAQMQTAGIQIDQKAISRIESGKRVITDYELARFAEILKVPIADLLRSPLYDAQDDPKSNNPYG